MTKDNTTGIRQPSVSAENISKVHVQKTKDWVFFGCVVLWKKPKWVKTWRNIKTFIRKMWWGFWETMCTC